MSIQDPAFRAYPGPNGIYYLVPASVKVDWVTYNADGIAPAMRVVDLIDHLRRLISQLERYEGPAT